MIGLLLEYDKPIIEGLIVLMAGATLKVKRHRYAALVFAMLTLGHSVLLSGYQDGRHFSSAALIDVAIISWTANLPQVSKLVKDLHRISLAFIIVSTVGWVTIKIGIDSAAYASAYPVITVSYMGLYLYSTWVFLTNEDDGTKRYSLGRWVSPLRLIKST